MELLGQKTCTFNILRNTIKKIVPLYNSISSQSASLPTLPTNTESFSIFATLIGKNLSFFSLLIRRNIFSYVYWPFSFPIVNCISPFFLNYGSINDYHLSVLTSYTRLKRDPFLQRFLSHSTAHSLVYVLLISFP